MLPCIFPIQHIYIYIASASKIIVVGRKLMASGILHTFTHTQAHSKSGSFDECVRLKKQQ